jgi:hypothetical protein
MSTQRKSKAPALLFLLALICQVIDFIIIRSHFGGIYSVSALILYFIFPGLFCVLYFIAPRSKILSLLYLAFAVYLLFFCGGFKYITITSVILYLIIIYVCLFALTFFPKSFSSSGIGTILKFVLLALVVLVCVFTVIRIKYMFMDYLNLSHLYSMILAFAAAAIALGNR